MLNPSTADHEEDDPTIRRCIGFAEDNGFDGIVVLNLYAFRSTDPENLWKCENPIGDLNDVYIGNIKEKVVICAWGKNAKKERVNQVLRILEANGVSVSCLGVNKNNSPKHPLYLAKGSKIMKWEQTTDTIKPNHNTSCTYQFELAFLHLQDTPELRKMYWSALGQLQFDSNDQVIPPELEECTCCKAGEQ
ncbi:hypothetical protein J658_3566 [Acinetobacter baumannii 573719]|nr:hypothetical protein J658_3566 [Acinetobacter baumannii 573719]